MIETLTVGFSQQEVKKILTAAVSSYCKKKYPNHSVNSLEFEDAPTVTVTFDGLDTDEEEKTNED